MVRGVDAHFIAPGVGTGELIRDVVADKREVRYSEEGVGSDYMFRLGRDKILDATRAGSIARYINHSCDVRIVGTWFLLIRVVRRSDVLL